MIAVALVPCASCPSGHPLTVETDVLTGQAYDVCAHGEYRVSLRGRPAPDEPHDKRRGMKDPKPWTDDARRGVVERLRAGQSVPEIAAELHRSQRMVYRVAKELAGGVKAARKA